MTFRFALLLLAARACLGQTPAELSNDATVRAAMETVPASLVFADGEENMAAVIPYRENRRDFPAVESGQIRGRVVVVQEGFFEKEPPLKPLPDAHILTSRDRDAFSEGDGSFVLADLAPGTYVLRLDPATVPRGLVPTPATRTVQVKPGQATGGADFRLVRPVIEKQATEVGRAAADVPSVLVQNPARAAEAAPKAALVADGGDGAAISGVGVRRRSRAADPALPRVSLRRRRGSPPQAGWRLTAIHPAAWTASASITRRMFPASFG